MIRLGWLALVMPLVGCVAHGVAMRPIAPIPDAEGFAGGFAGISHGVLVFAGGANFPAGKPWQGGVKHWYGDVYELAPHADGWSKIGALPGPRAYGASVSYHSSILCIGGGDARRNVADVVALEWDGANLVRSGLPSLPAPTANCCAAIVGDRLYVACGQRTPGSADASRDVYCMDLSATQRAWRPIEPLPGPARILATAASCDGAFWVVGGASLSTTPGVKVTRHYLADAYRYDAGKGWRRAADLPMALAASPSPAPTISKSIYLLGGDDGKDTEFKPPENHPGFDRSIIRYDALANVWVEAGTLPVAQVTTPAIQVRDKWIVCGGEIRPGVRTTRGWTITLPRTR